MIIKDNITLAYELALKVYKNKPFTFMQIWKDLVKKCKFDKNEQKNIAQFYADLLQDKRFIFVGNKKWKIREFLKHEEIVKLENALYDFEQDEQKPIESNDLEPDVEKEYDADLYNDENDNKNQNNANKQEKINSLDDLDHPEVQISEDNK